MITELPHTITRADVSGVPHTITLLGGGYYRLDDQQESQSGMVSSEGQVALYCSDTDPLARVVFGNTSSWSDENLGYENLWMLMCYYPFERTHGLSGYPIRGDEGRHYRE